MEDRRVCKTCGTEFICRHKNRAGKYCSKKCEADDRRLPPNTICIVCGKEFHLKPYRKGRAGKLGYVCSVRCSAERKKSAYSGEKNPNWKGRTHDCDGYRLYVPAASSSLNKRMKLHTAVCLEVLGVEKLPNGVHVHHRDCNVENNVAENLVVLSISDHKWLHKQYGVATLWAFSREKVSLSNLIDWSDDKDRAARLLPLDVTKQLFLNDNLLQGENNESASAYKAA